MTRLEATTRVLGPVGVVLLVVGSLIAGPGGKGDADLPRHSLVFVGHSDVARQDYDIWRICPDGTQLASVVVLPGHQYGLSVSPDGDELVYTSAHDIWRQSLIGGEAVNLTRHDASDSSPSWSPDGTMIAFFSDRAAEKPDLYLLQVESGEVLRLTHNTFYESGASWAPDGRKIVFTRYFPKEGETEYAGDGEVFEVDVETGEERQLTRLGGYNGGVDYAPDGSRIAFHRTQQGSEIWVMEADGSDPRPLTDTFVDEYSPAWSPDGNWIAFSAGTEHDGRGTFDLWLMRPDGTARRAVSLIGNTQMEPRWRPGTRYCR